MTKSRTRKQMKTAEQIREEEIIQKAHDIGVPAAQIIRGGFDIADVRIDDGERVATHRTLVNRGGTAIERWLHEPGSKLFGEPEKGAVRYCQALWQKIDKKGPRGHVRVDGRYIWTGQSEHEALAELATFKRRLPLKWWSVFENICRFDTGAAEAGGDLASNSRSANDAAKTCVAFVAAMIAQWRGL